MPAPKGNKNAQKFNIDEVIKKANDYISNPQNYEDVIPTVEGLADVLGMSRDTLYEYASKNEVVSDILKILNTKQSKRLITGGLLNKFNAAIVKLLLSRHGYIEKQEVDTNSTVNLNIESELKKLLEDEQQRKTQKSN